ncbi:MAG: NAD-dependent epimerase [Clostridiales bacterium GWF2_38_85]|nr:MAG: NAD-dependent epimerase [Clostridiales bacterium GWF2_38_85]HBL84299.1 NAD-dependent epimerase [Clostridiales bacterium]
MKRILITGANSYIGTSFENYLKQWPDEYRVDTIDMIDGSWKEKSFSGYDTVFHVAGIAHIKETKKNSHLYFEINRNLAIETAKKAKADGVRQFIFLSSMSVYGMETGVITKETKPFPKSNYGKSKYQAENEIVKLSHIEYKVAILRPPMVYGNGCKGNFQSLVNVTRRFSVFPRYENKRSMIFIDNLSSFVKMTIDDNLSSVMFPQNDEYACTDTIVLLIGKVIGKTIKFSKVLSPFIKVGIRFVPMIQKAFGSLIYMDTEDFNYSYCCTNFTESIQKSLK